MVCIKSLIFDRDKCSLKVLDQLLLPFEEKYIDIENLTDGYTVIKTMQVRGAPLIAIVGILSLLVHFSSKDNIISDNVYDFQKELRTNLDYLKSSRPTAVNLSNACDDITSILKETIHSVGEELGSGLQVEHLIDRIKDYGIKLLDDDVKTNHTLGELGANYILSYLKEVENFKGPFSVVTICNTGSLATAGYGTALGVVRNLWEKAQESCLGEEPRLVQVYTLETRPYNQGSRLTAFELGYENIPSTLITDSMISSLMKKLKRSKNDHATAPIKVALVGADRIALNGDTANKIGTLQLAKLCKFEKDKILFLVVAPTSTIDQQCRNEEDIVIEERPQNELKQVKGGLKTQEGYDIVNVEIAPNNTKVWNPSFDVTDYELIDGIVTERKVFVKGDNNMFNLKLK